MLGGLGICGRPFCCGSFLDEFQPVSIKMAKTQSLSLNPTKISGTCGRLMCCLKYEQEAYEDLVKHAPKMDSFVETPDGVTTRCPSSAAALPALRFLSSLPAGFPPLYFFFFRTVLFGRRGWVLCPSPPPAGCPNPPLNYRAGVPFFSPRRLFLFRLRRLSPAPERTPAPSGSVPFHCLLFCPSIFNPFVICPGRFSPAICGFSRIIPACEVRGDTDGNAPGFRLLSLRAIWLPTSLTPTAIQPSHALNIRILPYSSYKITKRKIKFR